MLTAVSLAAVFIDEPVFIYSETPDMVFAMISRTLLETSVVLFLKSDAYICHWHTDPCLKRDVLGVTV